MADKQIGQLEDEKTQPLDTDYLVVDSNTGTINPATNLPIYATYKVPVSGLQPYLLDDGVTSVTNKAPTSNAVKEQLDKLIPFEFALVEPQLVFNIVHNRNANIISIKFTDASVAHCIAFQKTGSAEIAEAAQKTISFERIIFCRALCRWNQGWARAQLHWLIQNMWPVAYPIYQAPCAKLCLM